MGLFVNGRRACAPVVVWLCVSNGCSAPSVPAADGRARVDARAPSDGPDATPLDVTSSRADTPVTYTCAVVADGSVRCEERRVCPTQPFQRPIAMTRAATCTPVPPRSVIASTSTAPRAARSPSTKTPTTTGTRPRRRRAGAAASRARPAPPSPGTIATTRARRSSAGGAPRPIRRCSTGSTTTATPPPPRSGASQSATGARRRSSPRASPCARR